MRNAAATLAVACWVAIALIAPAMGGEKADPAGAAKLSKEDREALELGRKVLAIKAAIERPDSPGALKAVRSLGLDTRYYVLVRGWLTQQLRGDQSILDASRDKPRPKIEARGAFLKKAIRAIDLE